MKRALFFDLDGTLWDAIEPLKDSWNATMKEAGQDWVFSYAEMKSYMGLTPEETVPLAFPFADKETGIRLFARCLKEEIAYLSQHPGTLYPREKEVLRVLKKSYPLYVVSNSGKGYIENYLSACSTAPYFKGRLCAGDTQKDKWENIRILMEREGLDEVIYIGDTEKDRIQSEKAGVPFIHAAYGFGKVPEAEYSIESLSELPAEVKKIFR